MLLLAEKKCWEHHLGFWLSSILGNCGGGVALCCALDWSMLMCFTQATYTLASLSFDVNCLAVVVVVVVHVVCFDLEAVD